MGFESERGSSPAADEVRAALERVLGSPGFSSKRRGDLLRYLVERTLAGDSQALSEYSIALDVFGKPESFDPRRESTVRAEMSRVRKALAEYYENGGSGDSMRLEFPAGGYAPAFVRTKELSETPKRRSKRWAWLAAALLIPLAAVTIWRWERGTTTVESVVVLPFINLTGDSGNDYLADGLAEGLTDALARVGSLRVVARTSAFQFKGTHADIREIGRKVHADAAIEGSVRKDGGQLQVTVQLNRTTDGYHMLSQVFRGSAGEEGRIQHEMVLPVLATLRPRVMPPIGRAPDPEAFDLVLKAKALRGYGMQDKFDQAVGLLNQAIQKDPQYSEAYSELASTYAAAATNSFVDPLGAANEAIAAAARAIQLDPAAATAYAAEGYAHAMVLNDWKQGEQELRNALRLLPQDAAIHQHLGLVLLVQGRFPQALAEARTAAQLDPLVPATGTSVGMVYFMQRQYRQALAEWRNLAALHPDAPAFHTLIGMALEAEGDYSAAEQEYKALAAQFPLTWKLRMMHLLAVCGKKEEAVRLAAQVEKTEPAADPLDFAATYGALGERDRGFQWLRQACEKRRSCWMLKVHPFLDPLRADARYPELLKRSGLAQ
jgi:adenylate cyclase